jgi:hypothetical protein
MITNIVILATSLITNSQQAIVGEANGKALIASQETVIQRTITLEDVVLRSAVTTNFVGFAFPPRPTITPNNAVATTNKPPPINTNSPAFKRRLEREQRMKPSTNALPKQVK